MTIRSPRRLTRANFTTRYVILTRVRVRHLLHSRDTLDIAIRGDYPADFLSGTQITYLALDTVVTR